MRINSVEQKGYANGIMDWKIFVRQDLVVAKASEFFYEFVGENSLDRKSTRLNSSHAT